MTLVIQFDDGTSCVSIGTEATGDRDGLSEREAQSVLTRWLAKEPWRGQLRRYAAAEMRVEARTDDALIDRVWAVMDARGMKIVRVKRQPPETNRSSLQSTGPKDSSTLRDEEEQPTSIEIQVLYEDGRPYGGCEIAIDIPGQDRCNAKLDGEGKVRLDPVPGSCTCVVTLPKALPMPDPHTEPLSPPNPNGSVLTVSRRNPGLVRMVTGKAHRIVIRRARVHLLQVEDLHFQVGRAILLADGEHPDEDEERGTTSGVTSLSVAAAVLKYVKEHREQQLLVAGHTDTTGSETFNADLSQARATNGSPSFGQSMTRASLLTRASPSPLDASLR